MKRTKAKFRVIGKLDRVSGLQYGTVIIDRANNVVEVRPLRRRRSWLFSLDSLIDHAVMRAIQAEVREKKIAKKKARKLGGRP